MCTHQPFKLHLSFLSLCSLHNAFQILMKVIRCTIITKQKLKYGPSVQVPVMQSKIGFHFTIQKKAFGRAKEKKKTPSICKKRRELFHPYINKILSYVQYCLHCNGGDGWRFMLLEWIIHFGWNRGLLCER